MKIFLKTKNLLFFLIFVSSLTIGQETSSELVPIKDLIPNIVVDLKYATTDNVFNNQKLYTSNECYMLMELAKKLIIIQDSLNNVRRLNGVEFPKGIGIKIWDAYRPRSVQYLMFEIFPDPTFVANPATGSNHNRGGAVDLTLVDLATGNELPMPTGFDDFSEAAGYDFPEHLLPANVVFNKNYLFDIMTKVGGLDSYIAEWWHYQLENNKNYPLLDYQIK